MRKNLSGQLIENVVEFVEQHGDLSGFVLLAMGECDDKGGGRSLGMIDGTGAQIHKLLCQLLDNDPVIFTGLMFELLSRKCGDSDMFDQLVDHMPEWPVDDDTVAKTSYKLDDTEQNEFTKLHTLEDLLGENDEK